MRHLVVVSVDLQGANEEETGYVREALESINLRPSLSGSEGKSFELPPNVFAGTIEGDDTVQIAEKVRVETGKALLHLGLDARVFVSVGQQWVWRGQHVRNKK